MSYRGAPHGFGRRDDRREIYGRDNDRSRSPGRRDREGPPRDRPRDREFDRDRRRDWEPDYAQQQNNPPRTSLPKHDSLPNRPRLEAAGPGPGARNAPGAPAHIDSANAAHEVAKVFAQFGDFVTQRAKLSYQRETLSKVMNRKERDFMNTRPRHAEFPSLTELHDKYKDTYTKERAELEKRAEENTKQFRELTESLSSILLQALSLADLPRRSSKAAAKPLSAPDSEAKINSLRELVDKQEEKIRGLLAKQNDTQADTQAAKIEALEQRLSGYEQRFELLLQREDQNKMLGGDQLVAIKNENSGLKEQAASLDLKLEGVTKQLAAALDTIKRLENSSARNDATVGAIGQTVDTHNRTLADLDINNIDSVVDTVMTRFPGLQVQSVSQAAEIEKLKKDLEPLRQKMGGLENAQNLIIQDIGSQLDVLGNKVKQLGESPAPAVAAAAPISQPAAAPPGPTLAEVKMEIKAVREDADKKHESLALAFSDLDSRYNNLTTTSLAEHIIGHLERLYPNARQLSADIDAVSNRVQGLESRVDKLDQSMGEEKQNIFKLYQQMATVREVPDLRASEKAKRSPALGQDAPQKKRKLGDATNGHAVGENGVNGGERS